MRSKCVNSTSGCKFVSGNLFSDIDFLYTTWTVLPFDAAFRLFWWFYTAHAQSRPYHYFRFKMWRDIWIQRIRFPINITGARHHFRWLLWMTIVTAHSQSVHYFYFLWQICRRKWIQRPRFPVTREHSACKSTFKGILSKSVRNRKLSMRVNNFRLRHQKCFCCWQNKSMYQIWFLKFGREIWALS